ncbi:MAG: substrate-binding domain-containing protein [Blautia sp.]|nr:substrate-binding domain-containing protein [Blautia sp.]
MKKVMISILTGLVLLVVLLAGMSQYYQKIEKQWKTSDDDILTYDRHYVMISDDRSALWQSIYESAKKKAKEQNAYLEWMGKDMLSSFSTEENMKIAIASDVDGIILYPDGGEEEKELISQARENAIPVVTVFADSPDSRRISCVGINYYQMGDLYRDWLIQSLKPGHTKIMILVDSKIQEENANLLYSRLFQAAESGKNNEQTAAIEVHDIDAASTFDAEEVIRDIILDEEVMPDILICTNTVSTECAYQAIIDYNKVGNIEIAGYYVTDDILSAISKGIIPFDIAPDTEQTGQLCVEALNEYLQYGYVSNYYNVRLNSITRKNVWEYMEQQEE